MQIANRILGVLVFSMLFCTFGWAQATAGISGSVSDAMGGVLPGVEITVTQTDTGISRNNVEGPGTWSFDLSLSKAFAVREDQRLEFRAEAYNVTNSFRPTNPAVNVRTPNTFALKYAF